MSPGPGYGGQSPRSPQPPARPSDGEARPSSRLRISRQASPRASPQPDASGHPFAAQTALADQRALRIEKEEKKMGSSRSPSPGRARLQATPPTTARPGSRPASRLSQASRPTTAVKEVHPYSAAAMLAKAHLPTIERSSKPNVARDKAQLVLRTILAERYKSILAGWLRNFDRNMNGSVSFQEFRRGLAELKFLGDISTLWRDLDDEDLGEITLDIICPIEGHQWRSFRCWCGIRFNSGRDMMNSILEAAGKPPADCCSRAVFLEGVTNCGWDLGNEETFFLAMDADEEDDLSMREFTWLEAEVRRRQQKEQAKERYKRERKGKNAAKLAGQAALTNFKGFLRKMFGCTYHAWRRALDQDGSMTLQRVELFKVCRTLNWKGDVRALWRSLDFDASGNTTIEELDPHSAQTLARFYDWAVHHFGNKPSRNLWREIDKRNKRKLPLQAFSDELQSLGYTYKLKTLVKWLDWQPKKYIEEDDLKVLDVWRPPAWLTATPDFEAASEFKRMLKAKYGHFLRAWRVVMDKDNSNNCNWHEFCSAARHIRFHGDVAGAWLALDEDVSGSISLAEIDKEANDILIEFKKWAIDQFGGVRSAFQVIDSDRSNEISSKEFRIAMRNFGYQGDVGALFECLDTEGERKLQYKEVVFLDNWELPEEENGSDNGDLPEGHSNPNREAMGALIDYRTDNPGPGAYDVPGFIGALPEMPLTRHSGAFTFKGRGGPSWDRPPESVGPDHYDTTNRTYQQKPSWSFASPRGPTRSRASPRDEVIAPGPGQYDVAPGLSGPQFSIGARNVMVMHPSGRVGLKELPPGGKVLRSTNQPPLRAGVA